MRTNLTADTYRRVYKKAMFLQKDMVAFGLLSGDKSDNIDVHVWMFQITIKIDQIAEDVRLFHK